MRCARGQVAIEYLITYAWVFVVIAVIIGILYALVGIREIHIQEACTAAPGWYCDALRFAILDVPIAEERELRIKGSFVNGLGFGANPTELNITILGPTLQGTYTIREGRCFGPRTCTVLPPLATSVAPGEELNISLTIPFADGTIPPGTMFRIRFELTYTSAVTGTPLRTAGMLYRRSS